MTILKDRNFKKYAIRNPKNISEIIKLTIGQEKNFRKNK